MITVNRLQLADARLMVEAAERRAADLGVAETICVCDDGGYAIALHRMDGAPWIAPYLPTAQDANNMLAPPGPGHLLGTDDLGRDIFSRLIYGAPATVR